MIRRTNPTVDPVSVCYFRAKKNPHRAVRAPIWDFPDDPPGVGLSGYQTLLPQTLLPNRVISVTMSPRFESTMYFILFPPGCFQFPTYSEFIGDLDSFSVAVASIAC